MTPQKNQTSIHDVFSNGKSIDAEIATIENNLDFFSKSSKLTVEIVAETMIALKDLDFNMKKLECSFELMLRNLDKTNRQIEIGAKQCDNLQQQIDKVLNKVLDMDFTTNDQNAIEFQTELLKMLNKQMDALLRIQINIFNS